MRIGTFFLIFLSIAAGQSSGTFALTGNMTTERAFPRATLLTNGKVLITGAESPAAGAEIYDPSTGVFSATGMTEAWEFHTSTLLPDGKVLLAGGGTARAELYDPATAAFTATGSMTRPRKWHQAVLLANGKVLVVGGELCNLSCDITAEIYDPATGAFSTTGSFVGGAAVASTATLLADGRVLVISYYTGLAQLYDPMSGLFSPAGSSFPVNSGGSAALLANGKVLLTGGLEDPGANIGADLYDPATGLFVPAADMKIALDDHSETLLPDRTVLVTGRDFGQLYDPATNTFRATGNLVTPRIGQAATLLPDGTVLIVGGFTPGISGPITGLVSAEIYHPFVATPAPVLLSLSQGQAAILHAGTSRVVSASDPAIAGEAIEIYCTGLIDGSVIPPQVSIGGRMAEILFFGNAPGYSDLNQINVRLPPGLAPGPDVPVRLTYLGRFSNEVTIAVR